MEAIWGGSYSQEWCSTAWSSSVRIECRHLFSILELHSGDDFGQLLKATQFSPSIFRTHAQFEHHVEYATPRQATLGSFGPMAYRAERGLDRVRRPDALPMLGSVKNLSHFYWRWLRGYAVIDFSRSCFSSACIDR